MTQNSETKLYLLRPRANLPRDADPWEPWYDKAFGFVIRAASKAEARHLAQAHADDEARSITGKPGVWIDAHYSTCNELTHDGEIGVVLKDFRAA